MPAMPATPASYIKGTDTNNFNVEISALKVCRISAKFMKMARRICKLHARNFKFLPQNSDNPSYATVVPAVHLFSNMYPTPCLPLAGFEPINAGNDVGGSFDV